MEKSIEHIWKNGFLAEDALVAPKVNDLYNKKSQSLVEKIRRMMNINVWGIAVFAGIILIHWALFENAYLGAFIFIVLMAYAVYSKIQIKQLREINKQENSYDYLKSFDQWLKDSMRYNVKIMRFFYPLLFLASSATIWLAAERELFMEKLTAKYPGSAFVTELPLLFFSSVVIVTLLMVVFAGKIYRWDVNLVYGRVFRKLEELIRDLEELRR